MEKIHLKMVLLILNYFTLKIKLHTLNSNQWKLNRLNWFLYYFFQVQLHVGLPSRQDIDFNIQEKLLPLTFKTFFSRNFFQFSYFISLFHIISLDFKAPKNYFLPIKSLSVFTFIFFFFFICELSNLIFLSWVVFQNFESFWQHQKERRSEMDKINRKFTYQSHPNGTHILFFYQADFFRSVLSDVKLYY